MQEGKQIIFEPHCVRLTQNTVSAAFQEQTRKWKRDEAEWKKGKKRMLTLKEFSGEQDQQAEGTALELESIKTTPIEKKS